ncbi:putative RNA-directed DNA polymerase [Helianthus debilis subsp. tardiflorus]
MLDVFSLYLFCYCPCMLLPCHTLMGMDEEEYQQVRYRKKSAGYENYRPVTTFFVTNLPGGISKGLLWKAFQPYGKIKDAYVARKRDARGNFFGFVRCEGVTNLDKVLVAMNTVTIFEAKLQVSLAKFDKDNKMFPQQQSAPMYKSQTGMAQVYRVKTNVPVTNTNGISYAGIVSGVQPKAATSKKVLVYGGKIASYPDHCMMRAVIGTAKDVKALERIRPMLDLAGYAENPVGYLGGLTVLITFKDKRAAVGFLNCKENVWGEVLYTAEGQEVPKERLAWLKIVGAPLQLRDTGFFDEVGELYGRAVWGSQFSWSVVDNSDGHCCVLTKVGQRIEEEVEVQWRGSRFLVWVLEDPKPLMPLPLEALSSNGNGVGAASSGSVARGGIELEVEEGEIRNDTMMSPESEPPDRPAMEVDRMEGGQSEDERVGLDQNVHERSQLHAHGEGESGFSATQSPSFVSHAPGDVHNFPPFQIGSKGGVDPGPCGRSRKRPRCFRSPVNSSPDGEASPHLEVSKKLFGGLMFDLNNSASCNSKEPEANSANPADITVDVAVTSPEAADGDLDQGRSATGDGPIRVVTPENGNLANGVRPSDVLQESSETIRVGHGLGFQVSGCANQETKMGKEDRFLISSFWGRSRFDFEMMEAVGRSGELLSLWDPTVFNRIGVTKHRHFLVVSGYIVGSGELVNVVNVYAQNDPVARRSLWAELLGLRRSMPGMWIMAGDFNDVRLPDERLGSEFVALNADHFNNFIDSADLLEYQMSGRRFTYISDNGTKLSKLDRYLVCRGFMNNWAGASLVALSNYISDHCPILLSTTPIDYGPIPTRIFNSWLEMPGLMDYVDNSFATFRFNGRADLGLATKLKWAKFRIKDWVLQFKKTKDGEYKEKLDQLEALELLAETRSLSMSEIEARTECKRNIMEMDKLKLMDIKQKSRVRWATDGDENSSYFHGVVNANTSSNRIHGLWLNGVWTVSPSIVKDSVFSFFTEKFTEPMPTRPALVCPNLSSVSDLEATSLVSPFSLTEIKKAVWDCEGDRAPGPDGINFHFIKQCWRHLEGDFVRVFSEFYENASLNQGCTTSFLTLIPKKVDPGGLGDYRPISLIGCINKIISKVLANRLKSVIHGLISELLGT